MKRPSDYNPYPDDGRGFGDYPMLPEISADMKSDWEDYDDPIAKRNFAEPVRKHFTQFFQPYSDQYLNMFFATFRSWSRLSK